MSTSKVSRMETMFFEKMLRCALLDRRSALMISSEQWTSLQGWVVFHKVLDMIVI